MPGVSQELLESSTWSSSAADGDCHKGNAVRVLGISRTNIPECFKIIEHTHGSGIVTPAALGQQLALDSFLNRQKPPSRAVFWTHLAEAVDRQEKEGDSEKAAAAAAAADERTNILAALEFAQVEAAAGGNKFAVRLNGSPRLGALV
ncbi:hypothetical protein MBM_02201 [Drepanopeziza brunnea f. sp. 'multigermtubi' MB_m1]|uniref:Uncharacterized protein n=1 Tax=Marssonina brunnea f. sp. multigermtubi (strain MB_m1) TaxID=1072389 RepID=K1Y528_MARBU|nr:uncharacterized protein MBM_02201 [Drepanopeziza brunnea f. sp. 'multigermtubi' MB_m1]EKD20249.1 hypothetical protein MBM_02201 [Drepanopeziza brunnea f. sp. 'multigermtubi' MB_m1]